MTLDNLIRAEARGAVDVYRPHSAVATVADQTVHTEFKKIYYCDVASLYPSIMAREKVAVGLPISFEGDIRSVRPDAFWFFYCKITTPVREADLYAPIQRRGCDRRIRTKTELEQLQV